CELLTGAPPYGDSPPMIVLERHLKSAIPVPSRQVAGIPAELDRLVAGALAKKPEERPRSAAALAASLRRITDETSPQRGTVPVAALRAAVTTRPGAAQTVSPPIAARHRAPAVLAAIVGIAIIAAIAA